MGKYKGRPADYRPALELNLRQKPEGAGLRKPPRLQGGPAALARREALILVHGFNNHEGEAAEAYVGFRLAQYSARDGLPAGTLDKLLGDAFWPGDADYWGFLDLGDFFVYPKAVAKAKDAAPRLQELIQRLPNLERVDFIAHSLGCRVVLETVARLLDAGRPSVGRVCLMAAAVPVEMLAPSGRFGAVLRKLQALGIRLHVLHSDGDSVLKFTFVPGQALAGSGERTLRALGLKGPPPDMPGLRANVTAQQIFGAGHSHYWGHQISDASMQAAEEAANFLGLGAKRRKIGVRVLS